LSARSGSALAARTFDNRIRHVGGIGVVFGQRSQLWWDLPVSEGFNLLRDIYRVEPAAYLRTRDELVAMLRLERLLDQPVRQLSLGQRMRAEIDYRGGNHLDARISAETPFEKELVISDN